MAAGVLGYGRPRRDASGRKGIAMNRFLLAQESVYDGVIRELASGQKTSHWMWFVFPQLKGLGKSAMAQKYALGSLNEAEDYLRHPVLGPRLRECTRLVNAVEGKTIHQIFGSPDDRKFHSSVTLFAQATADNQVFIDAIQKYFGGAYDPVTLELLER
jgi:uncharacterized protein (DUF1810 family)